MPLDRNPMKTKLVNGKPINIKHFNILKTERKCQIYEIAHMLAYLRDAFNYHNMIFIFLKIG